MQLSLIDPGIRIGIVGSEEAKFIPITKAKAYIEINKWLDQFPKIQYICSGECHLGGVDIYARQIALARGIKFIPYPPKKLTWEYYKKRNLQIANNSDIVLCVTVKDYHPGYKDLKFESCYHCDKAPKDRRPPPHVKSGGCWTAWQCKKQDWIII